LCHADFVVARQDKRAKRLCLALGKT